MLEMKIAVVQLLRQFIIKPSKKNRNPLPTVVRTTIMNPSEGVWITLEKRE